MIFTYEDMKAAERMARETPEHLHYRRYARLIDEFNDAHLCKKSEHRK